MFLESEEECVGHVFAADRNVVERKTVPENEKHPGVTESSPEVKLENVNEVNQTVETNISCMTRHTIQDSVVQPEKQLGAHRSGCGKTKMGCLITETFFQNLKVIVIFRLHSIKRLRVLSDASERSAGGMKINI